MTSSNCLAKLLRIQTVDFAIHTFLQQENASVEAARLMAYLFTTWLGEMADEPVGGRENQSQ